MSWFITVFWVFIATMLIWEFFSYNKNFSQVQAARPQDTHFFFYNTNVDAKPAAASKPAVAGPDVEQTAFTTENNVPSPGNFTAHITLKNLGTAKAVDVQIMVRPYRGIMVQSGEMSDQGNKYLDDGDPLAQYGQYVSFPDLAPGESATVDAVFLSHPNVDPGNNPKPEIDFGTDKAQ
jgi:hypothetical protein